MKKYIAALLVVLGLMLVMAVPAFAQEEFPGQGSGATDINPGMSEDSDSWHTTPPGNIPGSVSRNPEANENNPDQFQTGRGKRLT
jgi:hypothetical protein